MIMMLYVDYALNLYYMVKLYGYYVMVSAATLHNQVPEVLVLWSRVFSTELGGHVLVACATDYKIIQDRKS